MEARTKTLWTFAITSVALFMVVLDNLVVSTALPVIRVDLDASIEQLEWTVNAYTLTFAVFLLTGAALGDRFGRRRMFIIGLAIFTGASAAAALAPSMEALIAARAVQGLGGAIVTPLTLTLLSAAFPVERRGVALGAWSGIAGLAVAAGPLVGGAVVDGIAWQWIFWLNVPIGLAVLPLSRLLTESRGPDKALDLPGLGLVSAGLFGIVWGLVHGNSDGWTSPQIVFSLAAGGVLMAAFVAWEGRAKEPMLPLRFFRDRAFSAANGASLAMYFGMFGSIFLLSQFFQTAQGYSPFEAGLGCCPGPRCRWSWLRSRALSPIGGRSPVPRRRARLAGDRAGVDRGRSSADVSLLLARGAVHRLRDRDGHVLRAGREHVLTAVGRRDEGKASGASNAIREVGGVFGVAVLASIFSQVGGYETPESSSRVSSPRPGSAPRSSARAR